MTSSLPVHQPVLLEEAIVWLDIRPGGTYIDCTTGLGGHAEAILRRLGDDGRLLCIDQDAEALEFARARLTPFGRRVSFVHANFRELDRVAAEAGVTSADGILLDLGFSSYQVERAERGFSFSKEGPLDMRMDPSAGGPTAAEIVNTWDERSLAELFFALGEEPAARRIARAIVVARAVRPLRTTTELASVVGQAVGGARRHTPNHPATKVFQALRIQVNGELDSLHQVLPLAHGLLDPGSPDRHGGRLVVISFHSLEDRIVKQY
ncbi:16S rRNA (cytosine(1402)-N(4))-methyltransferase RsmH, partial [Tepidiforma sp.]|uniref:16S rRNA (cytosine(1402)-N(4))-methyltransferase RsmH n=1 Tax=Tepidiforma sp. TaxID=2682230 RepID=UPI002ADD8761